MTGKVVELRGNMYTVAEHSACPCSACTTWWRVRPWPSTAIGKPRGYTLASSVAMRVLGEDEIVLCLLAM